MIFGPDGNLYLADSTGDAGGRVVRFDGTTGAYIDDFVPAGSGGLKIVTQPGVRPDGRPARQARPVRHAAAGTDSILRYDGATGQFRGQFVATGSGGLDFPEGITFGPDGNLFVADGPRTANTGRAALPGAWGAPGPDAPADTWAEFIPR